ncbi:universal stress protein [Paractinoplanes hotanensis]|uniref:Universal stress protein n=1 Tax=Paractinoplanes hotanensis TaxID=2906497 RepID=A0ABT0YHD3_9ACTN|nr:universal stress protein [Actinoplanes hotanensis]MCM4085170.1 universal stress protein [Actinoplanes hotanensis]
MRTDRLITRVLPVMVGVNGSDATPALIDFAAAEAATYQVPLVLVHVWPGRYLGAFRGRSAQPSPADAQRLLTLAAARVGLVAPEVTTHTQLLDGSAARLLERASSRAGLLVVGHRDRADARSAWGSTTAYLAHHSACPLMIHHGSARDDGPVVVAASLRPTGETPLGFAFERAARAGAPLIVVHMWTTERAAAEHRLSLALKRWTTRFPGVAAECLVVTDLDMPHTIERSLRRGRLMVAGTGSRGSFTELLGSVRESRLGPPARCPNVLVPPERPQMGPKDPGKPGPATKV